MINLTTLVEQYAEDTAIAKKTQQFRHFLTNQYVGKIEELYFYITNQLDVLHVSNLRIKKEFRGKGIGSSIMNQLKKFADENKLIITLSPEADRGYKAKLNKFYRSHGFVWNKGRKKDYRISSFYGPNMVRRSMEEEVDRFELEDLEGKDAILQYLTSNGKDAEVVDLGGTEYIIWNDNIINLEWPNVKEKKHWIYSTECQRLVGELTGMVEDKFNAFFWQHPEVLFHATVQENVEDIRKKGLLAIHKGRGMSNRHIHYAVFTSTEPDWITHVYGPVVITIRTDLMKKDGFTPYVTKEPNHTEAEVIDFIAGKIKAWEPGTHDLSNAYSEGTTEDTVIIYESVPPKYLEVNDP